MGNREALLAGAKRCLYEKGYSQTTARDIVGAAGTSLAAIGYHFGSTESLLNAALQEAMAEWGDELARALASRDDPGPGSLARFESVWARVIESFPAHRRLWATQFELAAQIDQRPALSQMFAGAQREAREELATLFQGIDPADEVTSRQVGSFYQALLAGVMAQWLVDPEHAPTANDLASALRAIADGLGRAR